MKTFSGLVTTIVLGHCVGLCGGALNTDFNRYGEIIQAPPLPAPQGEIIRVSTVDALYGAVDRVGPGGTILLADGRFQLSRPLVLAGKRNVAIRGASGDPTKVMIVGQGWESEARNDDLLHIARCESVLIADLTFADCGIELWYADRIQVLHNSIWRPEENWSRGIRVGTGTTRTEIVNNLVHGEIRLEGGEARLSQKV